jgi:AraC-like DNA-binding protein
VDFVRHPLDADRVIWIRPGWTHSWDDIRAVTGSVVLFRAEFVPAGSPGADPLGPTGWRQATRPDLVRLAADHLRREYAAAVAGPRPGSAAILRHLLEALLLRVGDGAPRPSDGREVFTAFSRAVEAEYPRSREVAWYARRLGYAPRTLRRATREAVGIGAKRFIDDRVVLETKRLLAHTPRSAWRSVPGGSDSTTRRTSPSSSTPAPACHPARSPSRCAMSAISQRLLRPARGAGQRHRRPDDGVAAAGNVRGLS